jgi:hypothetical protein
MATTCNIYGACTLPPRLPYQPMLDLSNLLDGWHISAGTTAPYQSDRVALCLCWRRLVRVRPH